MEIVITKNFKKNYDRAPKYIQDAAKGVIEALQNAKDITEIEDIKKLAGFNNYYRVRIGDWRLGLQETKPKVFVMALMSRGSIYKVFPPYN